MRVIIADDSAWLRSDYRLALTASGIDVVAEAASADELIAQVRKYLPHAVLIDICLKGISERGHDDDGLTAAERLRAEYPELGLLIFSVFMTPTYLARILQIGEHHIGYLGKDRVTDFGEVIEALQRVTAGETAIDKNLWAVLLKHRSARGQLEIRLSERKRQALELMARGMSNKAIAKEMCVRKTTVEEYLSEVFAMLAISETPDTNKRVCAVLAWLRQTGALPEA
jgi:DNA-binding NarL/FixJ family response regulator